MTPEAAQTLALRLLAAIAGDQRHLERLMALSGIDADSLRNQADDPALLGGVLDFVLGDERMLTELCEDLALPPDAPAQARQALPGAAPDW